MFLINREHFGVLTAKHKTTLFLCDVAHSEAPDWVFKVSFEITAENNVL